MRISDWSSDVCSSDLLVGDLSLHGGGGGDVRLCGASTRKAAARRAGAGVRGAARDRAVHLQLQFRLSRRTAYRLRAGRGALRAADRPQHAVRARLSEDTARGALSRSEEHTSELQSLM